MGLLQKTLGSGESNDSALGGLKAKFESIKTSKVPEAAKFHIINAAAVVGCGCGGATVKGHFVIPNDDNADAIGRAIYSHISSSGKIGEGDIEDIIEKYPGVSFNKGTYIGEDMNYNPQNYANLY